MALAVMIVGIVGLVLCVRGRARGHHPTPPCDGCDWHHALDGWKELLEGGDSEGIFNGK